MAYTKAPVLIGRPGYSPEHYDFAFSGLGEDIATLQGRRANDLAMQGKYAEAGALISGYSATTQQNILAYLKHRLSAERYREVLRHTRLKSGAKADSGSTAASRLWDFAKGQFGGGGGIPGGAAGPNYLLWGGVAVGGLILIALLTRKPKAAAPANGSK